MKKFLRLLTQARGSLHVIGVVVGAVISALTATTMGGDPLVGAGIGSLVSATTATLA